MMNSIIFNKRKKNPILVKYKFIESGEFKSTFSTDDPEKYIDDLFKYNYLNYAAIGIKRGDLSYKIF